MGKMTRTCSCLVQQEDNGFTMDAKERRKTKKFTKIANKGWLGISDKYWITSLIPPKNNEFKIKNL